MQGGTKSLPNTPKEQDLSRQHPQFWSAGPKDLTEALTRPSGVRVKLFPEERNNSDVKSQKSVHWSTDSKLSDEGVQSAGSPVTFWNVENGIINNMTDGPGIALSGNSGYLGRNDFDIHIAKTAASQGSNVQATLLTVSRDQSTSGVSSASENLVAGIMSDASLSYPGDVPSQSVIQDRLLRDGHFTSSPKVDKTKSEVSRDASQDISLVSSISAPFELRPKAYDDTVISEETTFVDESDAENLHPDTQKMHQSDGAAQLISMRQGQSSSLPGSVALPPATSTAVPLSREQFMHRSQSVEEQNPLEYTNRQSQASSTALQLQGQNGGFHPLYNDSMMSTDSVNDQKAAPIMSVGHIEMKSKRASVTTDGHFTSKWVDNALSQHQSKGAPSTNGESRNVAIQNLEQVRSHLHNMINMTKEALPDKAAFDQTGDAGEELLEGLIDVKQDESFSSAGSFPVLGGKSLSDLENILNIGGGVMHSSGNYQGGSVNNSALFSEIQFSKEQLERERFRRKHCEKQITELQSKMLELQQQLAVAVSTDRKKETMIEHLDKALAKVVDGWKRKDNEKVEIIQKIEKENNDLRKKCEQQHEQLLKFTSEITDTKERWNLEKTRADKADQHIQLLIEQKTKDGEESKQILEKERIHLSQLEMEREELHEAKDKLLANLTDLQQIYENDKENWEDKERDYLQKIDEITENHLKGIDQERGKLDKQNGLLNDTQQVLSAAQTEIQNLKIQLDTATREKESLKVEMGLTEARLENSKRKLESDLRSELERQMAERLEEAHNRQMASEEDLRERHRRQIFELNQRHSAEMEQQLQHYQDDVRRKEEKITHQALSFEEKVTEMKVEMDTMKAYVKKLEGQRLEMTNKLQSMMQTHCNEALRLLQIGSSSSNAAGLPADIPKPDNVMQSMQINSTVNQVDRKSNVAAHLLFEEDNNAKRFVPSELQSTNPSQSYPPTKPLETGCMTGIRGVSVQNITHPVTSHRADNQLTNGQQFQQYVQYVENRQTHGLKENVPEFFATENIRSFRNASANNAADPGVQRSVPPQLQYQQTDDQSYSQHGSAAFPYSQRNPTFFETLAAEADEQENRRFQILRGSGKQKSTESEDFKPLSCDDSIMDATGADVMSFQSAYGENQDLSFSRAEENQDSIDLRLSTGTLPDDENNNSHTANKRSTNASLPSQTSTNTLDYKDFEGKVHVHEERQTELQHYIKMLLQKSPNSPEPQQEVPTNTPADCDHPQQDHRYSQSSIASTDKSVTLFSPTRAPETPPKPAFHKSLVGRAQFSNLLGDDAEMGSPGDSRGVLSPQQVGEISRLLGLYRPGPEGSSNITSAGTTPPMAELLAYLKDLNPEPSSHDTEFKVPQEAPTRDVISSKPAKRNLSSTYNTSAAKQVGNNTSVGSPTSSRGSPASNKVKPREQAPKQHVSKQLQGQPKQAATKGSHNAGKTSAVAGAASKKLDKKVVSSKAKHGVWK